jgi:formiminoglutamase
VGAAAAPDAIRKRLYRLVVWPELTSFGPDRAPILDLGNIAGGSDLDNTQTALGLVVAEVLAAGAIPVVLGGGHEIAYGHYQGYARAGLPCGILNVDAHLDVRPYDRGGHSGSPFRQAHEHPTHPLGPGRYVAFGVQRHSVSSRHCQYVEERGGRIVWTEAVASEADGLEQFHSQLDWLARDGLSIYLTVDADAFRQADVPGVSAPNPVGLPGELWPRLAAVAGSDRRVASIELGEVNPAADRDDQTARWAAVGLWSFLRVALGRSVPRPGGGSL